MNDQLILSFTTRYHIYYIIYIYILWYVHITHTHTVFPFHKINSIFVFGNLIFPLYILVYKTIMANQQSTEKIRRIIIFNLFLSSTFQYSNPILTISSSSIFCFSVVFLIFVYVMYIYSSIQFNSNQKLKKDVQQQTSTFELLLYTLRLYFYVLACFMAFSSHLLLVYFLFYLSHSLNLFCGSV